MIRQATAEDATQVCAIYNHYVSQTHITFEEVPVDADAMARRMASVLPDLPWLMWEEKGQLLGFSYAAKWKERSAYRYSVESTIYVRPDAVGKRIGLRLYQALLAELGAHRLHAVFGVIALPNAASVALHEKLGFVKIGHLREAGWKFGRWIDVGYWQLLL